MWRDQDARGYLRERDFADRASRYVHDARHPSDNGGRARARAADRGRHRRYEDGRRGGLHADDLAAVSARGPVRGIFRREDGLDIHVHSRAEQPCLCGMDPAELDVVRAILGSLADDAQIDYSEGKIRNILLTKKLKP